LKKNNALKRQPKARESRIEEEALRYRYWQDFIYKKILW
jgi:hypothetical protein